MEMATSPQPSTPNPPPLGVSWALKPQEPGQPPPWTSNRSEAWLTTTAGFCALPVITPRPKIKTTNSPIQVPANSDPNGFLNFPKMACITLPPIDSRRLHQTGVSPSSPPYPPPTAITAPNSRL